MPWTNKHMEWLVDTGKVITIASGHQAKVFEFSPDLDDDEIMSAWAKHFRNHYCDDREISDLSEGTGMSKSEYLLANKFPAEKFNKPNERTGPATRSGDFSEILVSDYMEFVLNYWVPRTRYEFKVNPNLSENGSDSIGFKFDTEGGYETDELLIYEVKARLSGNKPVNQLQVAVNDSNKDRFRITESLNAIKQRLRLKDRLEESKIVERFQNPTDRPYIEKYGAATVLVDTMYSEAELSATDAAAHEKSSSLSLLVIKGSELMPMVHKLYERAANEA